MSKRAKRRYKLILLKKKCEKILKKWGLIPSKKSIGKLASVHGAKCSCYLCGNNRKNFGKTLQEIKEDEFEKEQKDELHER